METEEGGKEEIKERISGTVIYDLQNVCTAARAAAATAVSSLKGLSAQRRWQWRSRVVSLDASKWLYDSCYQV